MIRLAAIAVLFAPAIVEAHPGHGHFAAGSWAHYLLEPVHAIPLAIVAWFAVIVVALRRRHLA